MEAHRQIQALLTLNGWEDKGYNQVGQLYGLAGGRNHAMPTFLLNYPNAPHNDQAAGWIGCVNTSPFDPIAGQQLGTQYLTPINPNGTPASNVGPVPGSNMAPPGYTGAERRVRIERGGRRRRAAGRAADELHSDAPEQRLLFRQSAHGLRTG